MNARQAGNVLRRNAPKGEHPAFINQQEASWLKGMGGSGRPTKSGLRSYAYEGRTMSDDENFGERGRSEKDWSYSPSDIESLDVRGWMDDNFGAVKQETKDAEHARVARMNTPGFDDQGNAIDPNAQGGGSGVPEVPNINNPLAGAGGGMQTRNNTSSSISEIDKPTHEFRKKVYDKSGEIMDREYESYGDATGNQRFADASADTTTAQQGVRDMQGVGRGEGGGYTSAGETATGVQGTSIDPITGQSFLTGRGVDEYMSPHTSNVIKGMQDSAMNTMQRQRNALQSQHQMAGAGMGSRGAIENAVMASEVQRGLGQQVAGALEGSYAQASKMKEGDMTREQQRQRYNQMATGEEGKLRLAGADTGIRATDADRRAGYEDSTMLSRVGADIEGRDQREKDFDYDEYIEGRDWDKNNAMFASNVLSGAPIGTTTTQNNPQYRNQKTDRFGRAIAGAGAGWLAGGPYGALAGGAMGYFS
jgi:hypothetical protein